MRLSGIRAAFTMALAYVALAAVPAPWALEPTDGYDPYVIPLKEFNLYSYTTPETQEAGRAVTDALTERYGGTWQIYAWNPQTGTPGNLYGSGAPVAAALLDASEVEAVARRVLATHAATLGVDPAALRLTATPHGLGKWAAHFQQTYQGLDVWGGRVHLTFTESGRLFAMGSEFYRGITLDATPRYSARQAEGVAQADLPFQAATDRIEEGTCLLVLPVPQSETAVEHHLAWRVKVRTADPLGVWVTWVDAHDGRILWRTNAIEKTDFVGDATIGRQFGTWCNGESVDNATYDRIQISGVGETNTNAQGDWTIPYAGSDPKTVTATLYGPYISVQNYNGAEAAFSGTATPGVPFRVAWTDANARQDERDTFDAINDVHDFISLFDPTFGYTNQRINAYVNRTDGYCPGNAWWDGTINFCAAGSNYANTGEIQGVVHHEFGHGITNYIIGSQGNEGIGEGNSDIISTLITGESIIGRGFYTGNCTGGIRDCENTLVYPDDVVGQPIHSAGRVICGFNWDFQQGMMGFYGIQVGTEMTGERWHFGRVLEHPNTQPAQVLATFIADDDDGDLTNGTPHYDFLCEAATNHGFSCPEITSGVRITHNYLGTTTSTDDREVLAVIYSTVTTMDADSVLVRYRVGGGDFATVHMTPTGSENEYHAMISSLAPLDEVEYYIRGVDEAGNARNSPTAAPAELYAFDIATVFDDLEQETGWTVDLEGTDTATSGYWERLDPVGTEAQPEDDHTPAPGTLSYVTGNASPGQPGGTNDVDGGTTTLYSPVYDLTGAIVAKGKFWRWYSNNMGNNPNSDTWVVQVRNNGGAWTDVERNQENQNRWRFVGTDLFALYGASLGQVQFKFAASDEGSGSLVEAVIDDFDLLYTSDQSGAPEAVSGPARFALHGSRVNPAAGSAEITFQVPARTAVTLAVFDVSGRAIRTLAQQTYDPGAHTLVWDGADGHGSPVAAGVYYCRMQASGFTAVRPVVLSR